MIKKNKSKKMKKIIKANLTSLDSVVKLLPKSGVVILKGDLASGKTTLVKAFVEACGIDDEVSSPTFSLMHCYGGRVWHYDLYRAGVEGILKNGLFENLFEDGVHFVEWGDEALKEALAKFGISVSEVKISQSEDVREYELDI